MAFGVSGWLWRRDVDRPRSSDHTGAMTTPPLERFPVDAELDCLAEVLERDGGVIVEGLVPGDVIADIRRAADGFAEQVAPGSATQGLGTDGADFVGANTIRFSSLATLTPAFFELLENPVFSALSDRVLLPACGSYWLNTAQVMYIGPGEQAQALHRDANNWWEFVSRTWPNSPEITLSTMIALDEVTEELGATRVVPGTHHDPELVRFDERPSVPAELQPGDGLIYSGYVLHGGGANKTVDRWRRAMHLSFVAGWLTPEESSPLDFPYGDLNQQSPRVQRLLGHRSYDPRPLKGGGLWLRHTKELGIGVVPPPAPVKSLEVPQ